MTVIDLEEERKRRLALPRPSAEVVEATHSPGEWASRAIAAEAFLALARQEIEELRAYKEAAKAALAAGAEKREALKAEIERLLSYYAARLAQK